MVSTDTLALSDALATIRTLSVELATARQERDDAIAAMNLATARRSACVCVYTAPLGQSIMDAVHEMHSIAKASGDVVTCRFNDINIAVRPAGRGNDCDGEAVQDDLWAKVRATLESGGFNFDELVERAAETLERWRHSPGRGDVADAGPGAGDERDDDCDGEADR